MKRVLAVSFLIAAQLAGSGAARGADVPRLAGTTKITGNSTALLRVVLPEAVTISARPFDNPVAKVSTSGQLGGIVLKQDVPKDAAEVVALSIDPCDERPCDQERLEFVQTYPFGDEGRLTLPAGPYLLYLVTGGTRTEVELNLSGLTGKETLRPSGRVAADFGELEPWALGDSGTLAYSASATPTLKRMGLTMVALEVEADAHVAGSYSSCLRSESDDAPPGVFHGSCSGTMGGWVWATPGGEPGRLLLVGLALEGRGRYVHGVTYQSAATVSAVRSFGFALSYASGKDGARTFSSTFSYEPSP